jgi:hypothetical protein
LEILEWERFVREKGLDLRWKGLGLGKGNGNWSRKKCWGWEMIGKRRRGWEFGKGDILKGMDWIGMEYGRFGWELVWVWM